MSRGIAFARVRRASTTPERGPEVRPADAASLETGTAPGTSSQLARRVTDNQPAGTGGMPSVGNGADVQDASRGRFSNKPTRILADSFGEPVGGFTRARK